MRSISFLLAGAVPLATAHAISKRAISQNIPSGWTYKGCYSDNTPNRVLAASSYTNSTGMTEESCISFCSSRGYTWAGTEYAQECYCDYHLDSSSTLEPESDCSMSCSGDSTETCGAGNRLTVFSNGGSGPVTNPGVDGWVSMGCYTDNVSNRTLVNYPSTPINSSTLTVAECLSGCKSSGYPYAGVEYSGECYCGFDIEHGGASASDQTTCNMLCNGNSSEFCGGSNRLNLYNLPTSMPATPGSGSPSWAAIGCWTDDVSARTLPYGEQVPGGYTNMTIEGCLATCQSNGFVLAGLEYSQECFCANSTRSGAGCASDQTTCNMPCRGNTRETCGGPNRLNMYQLGQGPLSSCPGVGGVASSSSSTAVAPTTSTVDVPTTTSSPASPTTTAVDTPTTTAVDTPTTTAVDTPTTTAVDTPTTTAVDTPTTTAVNTPTTTAVDTPTTTAVDTPTTTAVDTPTTTAVDTPTTTAVDTPTTTTTTTTDTSTTILTSDSSTTSAAAITSTTSSSVSAVDTPSTLTPTSSTSITTAIPTTASLTFTTVPIPSSSTSAAVSTSTSTSTSSSCSVRSGLTGTYGILLNGGFELGFTPWTYSVASGAVTAAVSNGLAYSGCSELYILPTSSPTLGTRQVTISQQIPTGYVSGTVMTVTAYVGRVNSAATGNSPTISVMFANTKVITALTCSGASCNLAGNGGAVYQQITGKFVAPTFSAGVTPTIKIIMTWSDTLANQPVLLDEVSLKVGSSL